MRGSCRGTACAVSRTGGGKRVQAEPGGTSSPGLKPAMTKAILSPFRSRAVSLLQTRFNVRTLTSLHEHTALIATFAPSAHAEVLALAYDMHESSAQLAQVIRR